jgi:hypothetical protein
LVSAGGFASVYLASLPDGNKVVVKKMFAGVSCAGMRGGNCP